MRHGHVLQTSRQTSHKRMHRWISTAIFQNIKEKNKLEHQEDFSQQFFLIYWQRTKEQNWKSFLLISLSNPHISNLISTRISPQMPSDTDKKKRNKTRVPVRKGISKFLEEEAFLLTSFISEIKKLVLTYYWHHPLLVTMLHWILLYHYLLPWQALRLRWSIMHKQVRNATLPTDICTVCDLLRLVICLAFSSWKLDCCCHYYWCCLIVMILVLHLRS